MPNPVNVPNLLADGALAYRKQSWDCCRDSQLPRRYRATIASRSFCLVCDKSADASEKLSLSMSLTLA